MNKGRLEAFSDGVLAIIITIMVLEMKAPEDTTLDALLPVLPIFLSYVLSFIYLAIYWINHHHLFQIVEHVNTKVLWANMHLLFWLSLIPFTTSWMGENHIEPLPVALYGFILLMSAASFRLLELTLINTHDRKTMIVQVISSGKKEKISIVLYLIGIVMAFTHFVISIVCYVIVAILWAISNKNFEK